MTHTAKQNNKKALCFDLMDPRKIQSCSSSYVSMKMKEEKETLRCCKDCKTIKTPMWRSGPAGPKSLCNACGIRFRKQRRSELLGIRIIQSTTKMKPLSSLPHGGVALKKRWGLKEEEQAALCLLLLSCNSVLAREKTEYLSLT